MVNYVNPAEVITAGIVLPLAAAITVALRFHARFKQRCPVGIDDWTIAFALATFVAMGIIITYGAAKHVLGHDTPSASTAGEPTTPSVLASKLFYAFDILMVLCYGTIKLSILFFYRRIFTVSRFNTLTTILLLITSTWTLTFFLAYIFKCGSNFSAAWSNNLQEYCHGSAAVEKTMALTDVILDVVIIAIPIPYVWNLQMPLSRKLAICAILLIGIVAIAASIARLAIDFTIHSRDPDSDYDLNQTLTIGMYWATLEAGLSIIAASLPSLRSTFPSDFIRQLREKLSLQPFRRPMTLHDIELAQTPSSIPNHFSKEAWLVTRSTVSETIEEV